MKRAFTPGLLVKNGVTIRRRRELPVKGKILVKSGDRVRAADTVATADLAGELYILKIAEKLSLLPEEIMGGLKVSLGQSVEKGQLICEHAGLFGWFKSRYFSPDAGVIEMISERTGHLGLRLPSLPLSLSAYISGEVAEVVPEQAVIIQSSAAFVQGIFGVGGERVGVLKPMASPATAVRASHVPTDCHGAVLFGGMCPDAEALSTAAARGAAAMVVGSVDDHALANYLGFDIGIAMTGDEDVSMTLIITEGFGALPMADASFKLLEQHSGKEAAVNGATQVRAGAVRPEIIVPLEQSGAKAVPEEPNGLMVGSKIRIVRYPYFGEFAEVLELPQELRTIESGVQTRVLVARLANKALVTVPRANIELV
ncbi:MAG: hypothetical protein K1X83_10315 [Oligoflexia bacterium]|nr:hypothetical protein [Oligoflexia bacterium]